jgi:uncharacterized protein (TIGR00290 family)
MDQILVSWSSGKDSALALYEMMHTPDYEVTALLTTIAEDSDRISMHSVRRALVERQAEALGLSLEAVLFTPTAPAEAYQDKMRRVLTSYRAKGVTAVVFGDIYLDDLRQSREGKLAQLDMKGLFPLWKRDTRELVETFIQLGFKAITTCVDTAVLDRRFLGRAIDESFLSELPASVDPCGENGEYHSFVFDGPIYREPIRFTPGKVTSYEARYYYCDLVPG